MGDYRTVYVDNGELVLIGYDGELTKEEQGGIVNEVINNYPKHQEGEDFNTYLNRLADAVKRILNARVRNKIENKESWNQFPHRKTLFNGVNPMSITRNIAKARKSGEKRLNQLFNRQEMLKHQVFPVARKTRKNRRKSSRKSRR